MHFSQLTQSSDANRKLCFKKPLKGASIYDHNSIFMDDKRQESKNRCETVVFGLNSLKVHSIQCFSVCLHLQAYVQDLYTVLIENKTNTK